VAVDLWHMQEEWMVHDDMPSPSTAWSLTVFLIWHMSDCRAVIVPVMERVLGPYLRGGGAKAFNFQALSQDLLTTTMEIPFSVPPYMSLLARSVATLEGIALTADPQYQMVAQVC
jgi:predicted unusual protein kinase regulating ubiquinone biosynthesis (AarF/ABC1/UbiB family)